MPPTPATPTRWIPPIGSSRLWFGAGSPDQAPKPAQLALGVLGGVVAAAAGARRVVVRRRAAGLRAVAGFLAAVFLAAGLRAAGLRAAGLRAAGLRAAVARPVLAPAAADRPPARRGAREPYGRA